MNDNDKFDAFDFIINEEDGVVIDRIPDDAFDSLQDADSLMVCELSREEREEDVEIVRAYEADIVL